MIIPDSKKIFGSTIKNRFVKKQFDKENLLMGKTKDEMKEELEKEGYVPAASNKVKFLFYWYKAISVVYASVFFYFFPFTFAVVPISDLFRKNFYYKDPDNFSA